MPSPRKDLLPRHSCWSVMGITLHEWGAGSREIQGGYLEGAAPNASTPRKCIQHRAGPWYRQNRQQTSWGEQNGPGPLCPWPLSGQCSCWCQGKVSQAGELTALSRSHGSATGDILASPHCTSHRLPCKEDLCLSKVPFMKSPTCYTFPGCSPFPMWTT